MKFVIDERIKNRLTGLVVVVSIAIIFLPAMMKKSNHRFDENMSVALKLPAKPQLPKVAIPQQKAMFQTIKVAHVEIPSVPHTQRASQFASAAPLYTKPSAVNQPNVARATNSSAVVKTAKNTASSKPVVGLKKATSIKVASAVKIIPKSEKMAYAVQLASFTQQENAKSLVSRLRQQGYSASYSLFSGKQGKYYQVLVGKVNQKDEAMLLQKKLIDNLQLSGFVVKTNMG